jgi:cation diffusion facilitator CzcD-associated flavoprotein CzcO
VDAACDPLTAAAVGFYEHIPRLPAAREDMPRWFQYSEIASSKEIFSYHIGDEAFQELLTHMVRNKDRYRQRPDRQVMPGSPAQPRLDRQADTDHR